MSWLTYDIAFTKPGRNLIIRRAEVSVFVHLGSFAMASLESDEVTDQRNVRGRGVGGHKEGADIIGVKNPEEGTLGAHFPSVIKRVCQITPAHLEVSSTVGDVPNLLGMVSLTGLGAAVCGVDYVKVGLFEVHRADEVIFLLRKVNPALKGWDLRIKVIAAGYADGHKVASLAPLLVPDVVAEADADRCLLDTVCKGEGIS